MSSFGDWFKTITNDVKAEFSGAKSELVTDAEALAAKLKSDVTPIAYAIIQSAVATAEVTGGTWEAKLFAAVVNVTQAFTTKGIPVVINDIVAAITAIVAQVNSSKAVTGV